MNRLQRILIGGLGIWWSAAAATTEHPIRVLHTDAMVSYPTRVEFSVEAEADTEIRTVELEYGAEGRDCSPDINIAIPSDFAPDTHIQEVWTLNVADTGSLPPGMRIWWDWYLVDAQGYEIRTEKKWVYWIDSVHDWTSIRSGNIILHWYQRGQAFAQDLMQTAESARTVLIRDVGTWPELDINVYIFNSTQAMRDALLGEPDWIYGMTFWENQRTIVIGIEPGDETYGKAAIAHELAHVAVNSIMGGCYGSIPLWLNEGIAVYAEGPPNPGYAKLVKDAIYYNELFSLWSISYEYQEIDGDPGLTYAESLSVVQFLVREYGHEKIQEVLRALGEGYTYDRALQSGFGVDMDGLETTWRKSIGADPMPQKTILPTPTSLANATLALISSTQVLSTLTPTVSAAPTLTATPNRSRDAGKVLLEFPESLLAMGCVGVCCLFLLVSFAGLLLWNRRPGSRKEG